MAELRKNIWQLDEWYDQNVAGDVTYQGVAQMWMFGRNWEYGLTNSPAFMPNNPNSRKSSPVQLTGSWAAGMGTKDGATTAVGVKQDNSVWVWGKAGPSGSLGLNQPTNTTCSSPKQLFGTSDATTRVQSMYDLCLVRHGGQMFSWGQGNYGQLGVDIGQNPAKRSSPCQIGSEGGWSDNFSTNGKQCIAVKTDGTLWVWGGSYGTGLVGQLGLNEGQNPKSSPTQVGTDSDWSTTIHHCCMGSGNATTVGCSKQDGTMYVWGLNGDAGCLGLSQTGGQTANARSSPTQLPGTTWATYHSGNGSQVLAVKTDGSLWTWGNNNQGSLGLNEKGQWYDDASHQSPVQVGTNTNWHMAWTNGGSLSYATKTDGTFWVWGENGPKARLGLNDQANRSSPCQIPGTDWKPSWQNMTPDRNMLFKEI